MDVKLQALPERIQWGKSVHLSFPGLLLVLSKIFQAIEVNNSRAKGSCSGLFSRGHLDCLPSFQSYVKQSKFYIHPPVVMFWTSPLRYSKVRAIKDHGKKFRSSLASSFSGSVHCIRHIDR